MPTIKSTSELNEQQEQQSQHDMAKRDVVKQLLTRFPYKEYGVAEDRRDGSITATFPNGTKIRMQHDTIEYYANASQLEYDDDFNTVISDIDAAMNADTKQKVVKLKQIIRIMSSSEFKQEKYSLISYLLGQKKLTIEEVRKLYAAYSVNDPAGMDASLREVYDNAVMYSLLYYKFLIGMMTVIN